MLTRHLLLFGIAFVTIFNIPVDQRLRAQKGQREKLYARTCNMLVHHEAGILLFDAFIGSESLKNKFILIYQANDIFCFERNCA